MRTVALVLLLLLSSSLHAQTTDWSAIEQLRPGTNLQILTRENRSCTLVDAAAEGIECEWHGFQWWVDRDEVRRVILPAHKATIIGVVVGAVAGATLARISDHNTSTPARVLRVGAAGALGGGAGFIVGKIIDSTRGRTIYQHP